MLFLVEILQGSPLFLDGNKRSILFCHGLLFMIFSDFFLHFVQIPLEDRTLFQMDQTTFTHQSILLMAIIKKRLGLKPELYTILQIGLCS